MKAYSGHPAGVPRRGRSIAIVASVGALALAAFGASSAAAQELGEAPADASADSAAAEARPAPATVSGMLKLAEENGFPRPAESAPWLAKRGKPKPQQRDNTCPDGHGCMWNYTGFNGNKKYAYSWQDGMGWLYHPDCCGGVYDFASAKNRFGNRRLQVWDGHSGHDRCLDPGENRPSLDWQMFYFNVGSAGSNC